MPVNNRIFFIFGFYRFLEDVTRWVGTSLWGITLRPIYGVRVADAEDTLRGSFRFEWLHICQRGQNRFLHRRIGKISQVTALREDG